MKLFFIFLCFIFVVTGCDSSTKEVDKPVVEKVAPKVIGDWGNEKCPVMGGKVKKDIFVIYKNKKVFFCCPPCIDKFNSDPAKYEKLLTKK